MGLKFYTSVAKGLKLKVRKFCGLISTFVEVTGEKLVGGFLAPPPPPILIRVKYLFLNLDLVFSHERHLVIFLPQAYSFFIWVNEFKVSMVVLQIIYQRDSKSFIRKIYVRPIIYYSRTYFLKSFTHNCHYH